MYPRKLICGNCCQPFKKEAHRFPASQKNEGFAAGFPGGRPLRIAKTYEPIFGRLPVVFTFARPLVARLLFPVRNVIRFASFFPSSTGFFVVKNHYLQGNQRFKGCHGCPVQLPLHEFFKLNTGACGNTITLPSPLFAACMRHFFQPFGAGHPLVAVRQFAAQP